MTEVPKTLADLQREWKKKEKLKSQLRKIAIPIFAILIIGGLIGGYYYQRNNADTLEVVLGLDIYAVSKDPEDYKPIKWYTLPGGGLEDLTNSLKYYMKVTPLNGLRPNDTLTTIITSGDFALLIISIYQDELKTKLSYHIDTDGYTPYLTLLENDKERNGVDVYFTLNKDDYSYHAKLPHLSDVMSKTIKLKLEKIPVFSTSGYESVNKMFYTLGKMPAVIRVQGNEKAVYGLYKRQSQPKESALMEAVYEGNEIKVKSLLAKGANANARNQYNMPVLVTAAGGNKTGIAKLLLTHGANIDAHKDGLTALTMACGKKDRKMVELLLSNRANPNIAMKNGQTAIFVAVGQGDSEVVKLLLSNGADINWEMQGNLTPLRFAQSLNQVEIVRVLLTAGAKSNSSPSRQLLSREPGLTD